MIRADYQLALLLQQQFEAETKRDNPNTSDYNIALMLQSHFEHESNIDNPKNGLVYDRNNCKDNTRSLVDPSWELIDPTPNIHALFVAFNGRFFWNKLQTVCVSWSKRMTTCAGICSYNPGGMCVITLSEPLLKLRPRKDLVETLLHEMIHAYLFVTHNNRDRDGHGPEFHKHMYRINKDAGTHITVYHSFHDEVRLYQQHWWRCNGSCQHRKPYFGIVRRAINRAPGPNDRWWNDHARTCGGTFVKIREPEKSSTKPQTDRTKAEIIKNDNKDIRNFVQVLNKKGKQIENDKNFNNRANGSKINGFANLNKSINMMRSNSNSTVVITKKPPTSTKASNLPSTSMNKDFQGTGQVLQSNTVVKNNDYSVVRNHWLSKFGSNTQAGNKRTQSDVAASEKGDESSKKSKLELEDSIECPVCSKKIPVSKLNGHLDECLKPQAEATCFICDRTLPESQLSNHQVSCFDSNFVEDFEVQRCEICNALIKQKHKEEHLKACLGKVFNSEVNKEVPQVSFVECHVCNEMIDSNNIERHTDSCLHKMFDDVENRAGLESSNVPVSCLACNKEVRRSELNAHLDECMKDVFDDKNEFVEIVQQGSEGGKSQPGTDSKGVKSYNCPFCLELYSEFDMCAHIDECLASDESNSDKKLLIDSFTNDQF